MLGLNTMDDYVSGSMISTGDSMPGYEIEASLGIVEGLSERSFPAVGIGGVGVFKGGDLDKLFEEAKRQAAHQAGQLGANAIIAFRYAVMGREVEKSVLAYGTAVKCRRRQTSSDKRDQ